MTMISVCPLQPEHMFTCNTVGSSWWVWNLFRSVAGQLFSRI